jgi:hypothetical protein
VNTIFHSEKTWVEIIKGKVVEHVRSNPQANHGM